MNDPYANDDRIAGTPPAPGMNLGDVYYVFFRHKWKIALVFVLGVAGAAIFLETLMLSYDKVPFTCTYLPGDNMRAMAPIYGLMFLIGASLFARLELAILTGGYAVAGIALLAAILIALRIVSALRPRVADIDFNEAPVTLHQLGLHN